MCLLKRTKVTTANDLHLACSAHLRLFFTSNSAVLLVGAQKYFLPQDAD